MTIRKRGDSWQIDVRTAEGNRIRRDYRSNEEATAAEAALKPTPQQRAANRKLRRKSSARSKPETASSNSSSPRSDDSDPSKLRLITSPESATFSGPRPTATGPTSNANSGSYSGPSGPGCPVSPRSRN